MEFYTIKEAIRTGSRLRLSLAEGEYVVEPHVLGRNRRGKILLRAWQLSSPRRDRTHWKVFDLDTIAHAVETGDHFAKPRPGYKPDDPDMTGGVIESV
ncbi:MAG: hypothetical protein ISP49_02275 [Reyranella sp.]|nr:hypothetical protein [Reyranella sp.]